MVVRFALSVLVEDQRCHVRIVFVGPRRGSIITTCFDPRTGPWNEHAARPLSFPPAPNRPFASSSFRRGVTWVE